MKEIKSLHVSGLKILAQAKSTAWHGGLTLPIYKISVRDFDLVAFGLADSGEQLDEPGLINIE